MKIKSIFLFTLIGLLLVGSAPAESLTQATPTATATASVDLSNPFTDRDKEIGYDTDSSHVITLEGSSASCASDSVQIDGSVVTIITEGTYILSGSLEDGMILIDAADSEKVQLVLNGATIASSTSAAIYVRSADKVFLTTATGTDNTLSNGGEYIAIDDNNIDAVVFSKADLTLNGAGTLTVNAAAGHGVVSKDDLVLTSGTYAITAASHGLSGKDSVRIANGTYTIASGKDGIHAENEDDISLGYLYIAGGAFAIDADGDGLSASSYLLIDGGTFDILAGGGAANAPVQTSAFPFGQRGGMWRKNPQKRPIPQAPKVSRPQPT